MSAPIKYDVDGRVMIDGQSVVVSHANGLAFTAAGRLAVNNIGIFDPSRGYEPPVAYAAGLDMLDASQTVECLGQVYAPVLADLPFTTSGTFETAKFRLIQGVASTDLAASSGASMVGYIPSGTGAVATTVQAQLRKGLTAVDYGAGIVITEPGQLLRDTDGGLWNINPTEPLPYTTTGAGLPEGGALVSVGDAVLRQELALPGGAENIGYMPDGVGAVATDVQTAIRALTFDSVADMAAAPNLKIGMKVRTLGYYAAGDGGGNDYEIVVASTGTDDGGSFIDLSASGSQAKGLFNGSLVFLEQFGARLDGTSVDTQQVQNAVNSSAVTGIERFSARRGGVCLCNGVTISASARFVGDFAFKRPDDVDIPATGTLATSGGVSVFDIVEAGVSLVFEGLRLDANQQGQSNPEPTGIFVRAGHVASSDPSIATHIVFDGTEYVNNCKLAVLVTTGPYSVHRTKVTVRNGASFSNGRFNTTTYDADFIRLADRADIVINDSRFQITTPPGAGEYRFPAVRLTTSEGFGVDEGCTAFISNSKFYGLGRPDDTGAAIGVIDAYEQARDVFVNKCHFENCVKSPVRAKTSIQRLHVTHNTFINCLGDYAVNINPTKDTVPPNFGNYIIDGNTFKDCSGMVSVVSNISLLSPAYSVIISNNTGEGINAASGAIYVRRIDGVNVEGNMIKNNNRMGVRLFECKNQKVLNNTVVDSGTETTDIGIFIDAAFGDALVSGNIVKSVSGLGIRITAHSSATPAAIATENIVDSALDYGVGCMSGTFSTINISGNSVYNLTGMNRAFYVVSTRGSLIVIGNSTDAATPLINASGGPISALGNSWQMI